MARGRGRNDAKTRKTFKSKSDHFSFFRFFLSFYQIFAILKLQCLMKEEISIDFQSLFFLMRMEPPTTLEAKNHTSHTIEHRSIGPQGFGGPLVVPFDTLGICGAKKRLRTTAMKVNIQIKSVKQITACRSFNVHGNQIRKRLQP